MRFILRPLSCVLERPNRSKLLPFHNMWSIHSQFLLLINIQLGFDVELHFQIQINSENGYNDVNTSSNNKYNTDVRSTSKWGPCFCECLPSVRSSYLLQIHLTMVHNTVRKQDKVFEERWMINQDGPPAKATRRTHPITIRKSFNDNVLPRWTPLLTSNSSKILRW